MKAVILCPGPSLFKTWDNDFAGTILAVNRAALWYSSEIWACGDWPLQQSIHFDVKGSPTLLTAKTSAERIEKEQPWRGKIALFETLSDFAFSKGCVNWWFTTALAGMVYLASTGIKEIDVYGCDLIGTADADGIEPTDANNRSEARWDLERSLWNINSERMGLDVRYHQIKNSGPDGVIV